MKRALMTALLLLSLIPASGFAASIVEEAAALEQKMKLVKPDLDNPDTIDAQVDLAVEAANFVASRLKGKLDQTSFEAIAKIIILGHLYDGQDYIGEKAGEQIIKFGDRLDKTFIKFEEEGKFSRKVLKEIRPFYREAKSRKG